MACGNFHEKWTHILLTALMHNWYTVIHGALLFMRSVGINPIQNYIDKSGLNARDFNDPSNYTTPTLS